MFPNDTRSQSPIVKFKFNPVNKQHNFLQFQESLQNYANRFLPGIGQAITTGTLADIPARANLPAENAHTLEIYSWKTAETARLKKITDRENSLRALHGLIMENLTLEIYNFVRTHADFRTTANNENGFELFQLTKLIIYGRNTSESQVAREKRLFDSFRNCKQGDDEPIDAFYLRMSEAVCHIV